MSSYQSDILATGLKTVFCGINPAESAERAGHNFSTPSNRFWTVLISQASLPSVFGLKMSAVYSTTIVESRRSFAGRRGGRVRCRPRNSDGLGLNSRSECAALRRVRSRSWGSAHTQP